MVSRTMIVEAFSSMLGLDEEKLSEIIRDKDRPMVLRIVAKAMLEKSGIDIIEKILTRTHGAPKADVKIVQETNITADWYKNASTEELLDMIKKLNEDIG